MNAFEMLLTGNGFAALRISDAGQILIYFVYGAIILVFAGAFIRIYKEFGLAKIVKSIREGRDPVKERPPTRELDQFEAWLTDEIRVDSERFYRLIEDGRYNLADDARAREKALRGVLIKYRELVK